MKMPFQFYFAIEHNSFEKGKPYTEMTINTKLSFKKLLTLHIVTHKLYIKHNLIQQL